MAKRMATEERSSGPKSSATTGAAKVLARSSRNAATRESSKKSTTTSKVPTAGTRPRKGPSQPKAKCPRRSAATDTSFISATTADAPSATPPAEVPPAHPPAQAPNTAAVVAEVLAQLQQGGFLIKPITTGADAPAADAGRVAVNIGTEDIVETTLTSLLHGEPQPLQAPEGEKFISASIPLANQVPNKIKQKIWADEFVEMSELGSDQGDQKIAVTL